jgi:hypothetical protein
MGQLELLDQPVQGIGLFQRVEVLALDVLDQRHGDGGAVRPRRGPRRGSPGQAGQLRRAPAALAGDDLVACLCRADRPHHDGLHHTLGLDGVGQILQRLLMHVMRG